MNIPLEKYAGKRLCVAVSGGKDSMALLHYLINHAGEYDISLSALNCDHCIRGEESERDSAFVKAYCATNGVELYFFKWKWAKITNESDARAWRVGCYRDVIGAGKADLVATAHHMNDNAETVLFNLARGTSLCGMTGIEDDFATGLVRPLIGCTRGEIDEYIEENNIPYVTDSTNLEDGYTRNKIRHNVLPALEEAVPGAVKNIYRFSRLAEEDEEYFGRKVNEIVHERLFGQYFIDFCPERVIFKRALQRLVSREFGKKDYTSEQFERIFCLQSAQNGKRFEFLGLAAVKEEGGISLFDLSLQAVADSGFAFYENFGEVNACLGVAACTDYERSEEKILSVLQGYELPLKILRFDLDKIPQSAVIRFKRTGDKFKKFGGGTKSLGDFFTDRKIPVALRKAIPLVCDGSNVLIVGGVEISDGVKITDGTKNIGVFISPEVIVKK